MHLLLPRSPQPLPNHIAEASHVVSSAHKIKFEFAKTISIVSPQIIALLCKRFALLYGRFSGNAEELGNARSVLRSATGRQYSGSAQPDVVHCVSNFVPTPPHSFSASQEVPHILWNPKLHYRESNVYFTMHHCNR